MAAASADGSGDVGEGGAASETCSHHRAACVDRNAWAQTPASVVGLAHPSRSSDIGQPREPSGVPVPRLRPPGQRRRERREEHPRRLTSARQQGGNRCHTVGCRPRGALRAKPPSPPETYPRVHAPDPRVITRQPPRRSKVPTTSTARDTKKPRASARAGATARQPVGGC